MRASYTALNVAVVLLNSVALRFEGRRCLRLLKAFAGLVILELVFILALMACLTTVQLT